MRIFAQRSIGVGETCFYEIFRTNGGFGGLYGKFRTDKQVLGDCAFLRILAQRSSGVSGDCAP